MLSLKKASPNQVSIGDLTKVAIHCGILKLHPLTVTRRACIMLATSAGLSEWKVRKTLAECWGREDLL